MIDECLKMLNLCLSALYYRSTVTYEGLNICDCIVKCFVDNVIKISFIG